MGARLLYRLVGSDPVHLRPQAHVSTWKQPFEPQRRQDAEGKQEVMG